jgi:hypothetical protein
MIGLPSLSWKVCYVPCVVGCLAGVKRLYIFCKDDYARKLVDPGRKSYSVPAAVECEKWRERTNAADAASVAM